MASGEARVAAVLLAAGESRRMGQPKQLLPWQGQTLVRHMAQMALAADVAHLLVVVGCEADAVTAALGGLPVAMVYNDDYRSGQASSLRVGINSLGTSYNAALVVLVDQPLLRPALLDSLIATWRTTRAPLVVPRHKGQRGNPVLIGRELWPELTDLSGDTGARALFTRHAGRIAWVEADASVVVDMDTPAAYAALAAEHPL
jgi:molybdenum cofactor cytidylyltransferase